MFGWIYSVRRERYLPLSWSMLHSIIIMSHLSICLIIDHIHFTVFLAYHTSCWELTFDHVELFMENKTFKHRKIVIFIFFQLIFNQYYLVLLIKTFLKLFFCCYFLSNKMKIFIFIEFSSKNQQQSNWKQSETFFSAI